MSKNKLLIFEVFGCLLFVCQSFDDVSFAITFTRHRFSIAFLHWGILVDDSILKNKHGNETY